jgi:hypothetical protein
MSLEEAVKKAVARVTPRHPPFICPGCGEACPFPTQVFESLAVDEDPSEKMVTCGCGMTHKLTRASGALSEVPSGVTVDKDWRAKRDAKHKAERAEEMKVNAEKAAAFRAQGKCPHCEGSGKVAV